MRHAPASASSPMAQAGLPDPDLELVTARDPDAMARHSRLGQRIAQPTGVPRLARDDHATRPLPEQRGRRSRCLDRHRCAAAGRDGDARERNRQAADRDVVGGGGDAIRREAWEQADDPAHRFRVERRPPTTKASLPGELGGCQRARRRRRGRRSARSRRRCATPSAPRDRARRGGRPFPRPASGGSVRPASRCRG